MWRANKKGRWLRPHEMCQVLAGVLLDLYGQVCSLQTWLRTRNHALQHKSYCVVFFSHSSDFCCDISITEYARCIKKHRLCGLNWSNTHSLVLENIFMDGLQCSDLDLVGSTCSWYQWFQFWSRKKSLLTLFTIKQLAFYRCQLCFWGDGSLV